MCWRRHWEPARKHPPSESMSPTPAKAFRPNRCQRSSTDFIESIRLAPRLPAVLDLDSRSFRASCCYTVAMWKSQVEWGRAPASRSAFRSRAQDDGNPISARVLRLPGRWAGLGLSANYGYTASRTADIPGRSDHPRLLPTSPNAFNISPTYDLGRVSLRVGMSYNQASIYGYQYADGTPGGLNGPLSDIYFYTHFQVDAQGSVQLPHGLTFVITG